MGAGSWQIREVLIRSTKNPARRSTRTQSWSLQRLVVCLDWVYSLLPNASLARKISRESRVPTIRCKISLVHPLATSLQPAGGTSAGQIVAKSASSSRASEALSLVASGSRPARPLPQHWEAWQKNGTIEVANRTRNPFLVHRSNWLKLGWRITGIHTIASLAPMQLWRTEVTDGARCIRNVLTLKFGHRHHDPSAYAMEDPACAASHS
jgi:hypothetical protein